MLRNASLSVARGEFVSLIGPSGSGKTTLLNLVAGLEKPEAGAVRVAGHDLGGYDDERLAHYRQRVIGYAPQFFELLPSLTALENTALPLIIARQPRGEALRRAREMLALFQLASQAEATLERLSGGERQRLSLARALVHRPRLLLADEPTASLDSVETDLTLELLKRLQRQDGLSILMTTHNPRVAVYAGRIVKLRDGRISEGREGGRVGA